MEVRCGTCGSAFEVSDPGALAAGGIDCPVCGNQITEAPSSLELDFGGDDSGDGALDLDGDLPVLDTEEDTDTGAQAPADLPDEESVVADGEDPSPAAGLSASSSASLTLKTVNFEGRQGFAVSRRGPPPWRAYAGWGAVVVASMALAGYSAYKRSLPPPPPEMPNPLAKRAELWSEEGVRARPVEQALATAEKNLFGGPRKRAVAFEALRAALVSDPDHPEAIIAYTDLLSRMPDAVDEVMVDEALGAVSSTVGEDPDSEFRSELEEARAWLMLEQLQIDAARQAAQKAIEVAPNRPGARLVHAAADLSLAPERSIADIEKVLKDKPDDIRARHWLAKAQLRGGFVLEAIKTLNGALKGGARDEPLLRELSRLYLALGDFDHAMKILDKLRERSLANYEDALYAARIVSRSRAETDRGLEILRQALKEPMLADVARARLLTEQVRIVVEADETMGFQREVSEWLNQGFDLAPDLAELLYVAAHADFATGRDEQALELLEDANGMYPAIPELAFLLAWRLRQRDPGSALEIVESALREAVDFVPLYLLNALLVFDDGKRVEALQKLKRAFAKDPNVLLQKIKLRVFSQPRAAYRELAEVLLERGQSARNAMLITAAAAASYCAEDFKRSSRALASALRFDRDNPSANLYSGILAQRVGRSSARKKFITKAWTLDRGSPLTQLSYARVLEGARDPTKALNLYRDLVEKNPLHAAAQVGLARLLWRTGSKEEALTTARRVVSMRPYDLEALNFLVKPRAASR